MMPKVMTLTDAAASRVAAMMAQKSGVKGLKIGVKKGGCAGMEYTMSWAEEVGKFDEVIEEKGAVVLIDPAAIMYLLGTEMDFKIDKLCLAIRVQQSEPEERLRVRRERQSRAGYPEGFRSGRSLIGNDVRAPHLNASQSATLAARRRDLTSLAPAP